MKKAFALIYVLIYVLLILLTVVLITNIMLAAARQSRLDKAALQARASAESGIEEGIAAKQRGTGSTARGLYIESKEEFSGEPNIGKCAMGCYRVEYSGSTITSTGYGVLGASVVKVILKADPRSPGGGMPGYIIQQIGG